MMLMLCLSKKFALGGNGRLEEEKGLRSHRRPCSFGRCSSEGVKEGGHQMLLANDFLSSLSSLSLSLGQREV